MPQGMWSKFRQCQKRKGTEAQKESSRKNYLKNREKHLKQGKERRDYIASVIKHDEKMAVEGIEGNGELRGV